MYIHTLNAEPVLFMNFTYPEKANLKIPMLRMLLAPPMLFATMLQIKEKIIYALLKFDVTNIPVTESIQRKGLVFQRNI